MTTVTLDLPNPKADLGAIIKEVEDSPSLFIEQAVDHPWMFSEGEILDVSHVVDGEG